MPPHAWAPTPEEALPPQPCPTRCTAWPARPFRAQVLRLAGQILQHLAAARGQVQDGGGRHVHRLHVVPVIKATLAASAAGTADTAAAQVSAASGCTGAGGAAA